MKNPFKWIEKRFRLTDTDEWGRFLSLSSKTGVNVTEDTALKSTAVWACVRLISETVASLPLILYERMERGKKRAFNHPLYSLLHDTPNPEMSAFTFREIMQSHLLTWGNCYSEIDYGPDGYGNGYPKGLWPLLPDRMTVKREKGVLKYYYQLPSGEQVIIPAYRVLHIPGMGYDGLVGYSPIRMAREAIGLSLATEEFGARFFSNGSTFGGFLEHPGKLSAEAQERLLKSFEEKNQGLDKAHRLSILEEGLKYQQVGIPPEDAQFIETRKFQISEIARFFHIPPHMIGDLDKATFSNIEHQTIEFIVYTMRPWLVRWEQMIGRKLMVPKDRQQYFAEFLIEGLLRGDSAARSQFYNQMFMVGAFSPNDIREKENMNPIEGGDNYYIPLNMIPANSPLSDNEMGQDSRDVELRQLRRGAISRHKIALSYRSVFEKAAREIVKREKSHIVKNAKEKLGQRSVIAWNDWLDNFYREFVDYIRKQISGPVEGLVKAIMPMVANEINADTKTLPDINEYVRRYADIFAREYAKSSEGQLKQLARDNQITDISPIDAITERMEEWEERRPAKVAMNETIKCSNVLAKAVFVGAGITKLVWYATGGQPCEFCQQLDGQVVGTEGKFSVSGLSSSSTPPIHEGCECTIMASR